MTNNSTAIAKSSASAAEAEVAAAEIIQGNFKSDTDREEFSQAIRMHGITFLYLANSPLPRPSQHDLGMIERLARSLAHFWPQSLVIGGCHD